MSHNETKPQDLGAAGAPPPLLRVAGCGEGQGLLFGGATPADRIPEILARDAMRAGAAA